MPEFVVILNSKQVKDVLLAVKAHGEAGALTPDECLGIHDRVVQALDLHDEVMQEQEDNGS